MNKPLLDELEELVEQGRDLTALTCGEALGKFCEWPGPRGQVLAIRMANHLGGSTQGRYLLKKAHQRWRDDPAVQYYFWMDRCNSKRVVERWLELRNLELSSTASTTIQAHWLAMKATFLAMMRDFERADALMAKALHLAPEDAWVRFEQGVIFERADRNEEALVAYQESLAIRPGYRPAAQACANRLHHERRDREALDLLRAADATNESGAIRWQLSVLLEECELYQEAWNCLEDLERFFPFARKSRAGDWLDILAQRRCDLAYSLGRYDEAIEWGSQTKSKFYEAVTTTLRANRESGRRVRLRVPFVEQSRMTCAPASLAMLCDFFSVPATHDEIASRICYDGTRAEDERRWADESGLTAREFRVDVESAKSLLEAGFPFAMQTVEPGAAHLQVVAGYDSFRGTLLIQDPGSPILREALAEEFLKRYAPTGPAGLVIAPPARSSELTAIELPESELYDILHRLQRALADHRREDAVMELENFKAVAPDHRLTLTAESILAGYDGLPLVQLAATEALVQRFPNDEALALARIQTLAMLERSDTQRRLLESWLHNNKGGLATWFRFAEMLESAKDRKLRKYWLRRILSYHPTHAAALHQMANLWWDEGRRDDAHEFYRLTACVENKQEAYSATYFTVSRILGKSEEAIQFLRERFANYAFQSGQPGLTLARAYRELDEHHKARMVLKDCIELRPEDGELILGIVHLLPSLDRMEMAKNLLAMHQAHCRPVDWLIAKARLREMSGKLSGALGIWRRLAEEDSLYVQAHSETARLLADTKNPEVALDYVRKASDRHPNSRDLATLAISWLRSERQFEEAEIRLTKMLDAHPDDAWAYRERAFVRAQRNQLDEALIDAESAIDRDPSYASFEIRGSVQAMFGMISESRISFQAALKDSIDSQFAQNAWLRDCKTQRDKLEALEWIIDRIKSERTRGEGLMTWYAWARNEYHPDKIWERVEEAYQARPDLWQTWSIRLAQLSGMRKHAEALEFAGRYVERFPLMPIAWVDRADAALAADRRDLEIQSHQEALRLNSQWMRPAVSLAIAQQAIQQFAEAEQTLRKSLAGDPRSAPTRLQLAKLFEETNRHDEALEQLAMAAAMNPHDDDVWRRLAQTSEMIDQGTTSRRIAHELTQRRAQDNRSWLRLAEMLHRRELRPEAYAALDESLRLQPRNLDAIDLYAQYLASDGLLEKAVQICQENALAGTPQPALIWRRAMIHESINDLPSAIETMQELLKIDPSFFNGWSKLAEWAEKLNIHEEYDQAALKMIELDPHHPVGYGYRSSTLLRSDEREKAIELLEKALSLEPNYTFATYELIRLYIEDEDFDAAQAVLERTGSQLPEVQRAELDLRIMLACPVVGEDPRNPFEMLDDLIDLSHDETIYVERAIRDAHPFRHAELIEWAWTRLVDPTLANSAHGQIWAELASRQKGQNERTVSRRLLEIEDSPGWVGAIRSMVYRLREQDKPHQLVSFVSRLQRRIQQHPELDAMIPIEFLRLGLYPAIKKWCRSWLDDRDRPASDYLAMIIGLWNTGKVRRALQTARNVAGRKNFDESPLLQLWLAITWLYEKKIDELTDQLKKINTHQLDQWYAGLYQMLAATTIVYRQEDLEARKNTQTVLEMETQRFIRQYPDAYSRRIAYRCLAVGYQATRQSRKSWFYYLKSRFF